ncbi:hypothetical protein BU24DRAFT_420832, partial [Aaosphaeria arxii CBS 175.79]
MNIQHQNSYAPIPTTPPQQSGKRSASALAPPPPARPPPPTQRMHWRPQSTKIVTFALLTRSAARRRAGAAPRCSFRERSASCSSL